MAQRKYFVDWVRVLAFFSLIFFHCAMPFVTFGWEIKNKEQSIGLTRLIWWLHQWRLPLLFFVAGVGIHYSLVKRSVFAFAGERIVRLFIPLLFAMFFTIPFQVYFEWLQKGRITGSYFNFYPQVWRMIPYPEGALTWSHMWFVVYLFVFCIVLIPVFSLFKIRVLQTFKSFLADKLSGGLITPLLFLPLAFYYFTLFIKYPEQQSLLDDWFLFIFSITLMFYGYLLGGSEKFWNTCERYKYHYLITSVLCIIILFYNFWWSFNLPKQNDLMLYLYGTLNSIHIWLLILAALGFAKKYLNFSNRFLQFTNQAVYPFYILHQTIIVTLGFYIVQLPIPIFLKLLILLAVTFIAVFAIYRFIIKPFIITRILYGLKPREKNNSPSSE
ncbi:MAG: acyltransferase family protein [Sediminibacterium sp.]|nr:acyltransferase family protein [Sediminibacterium sp.]MBX9779810.1 acyltransferase family protein [Chitinophagaceae bacterium]